MKQEEIDLLERLKEVGAKIAEEFNVPWRGLDNIFYQVPLDRMVESKSISLEFVNYFRNDYPLSFLNYVKVKRDNLEEIIEFSIQHHLSSTTMWSNIVQNNLLSSDFIIKYYGEISRFCVEYILFTYQKLPFSIIEKALENGISTEYIIRYQKIPEEILEKYFDKIKDGDGLGIIISTQDISEEFIIRHAADYAEIGYFGNVFLSPYLNLSEEFCKKFEDEVQQIKIVFPDGHEECRLSVKIKRDLDSKIYSYDRYKNYKIIEISEDNSLIIVE